VQVALGSLDVQVSVKGTPGLNTPEAVRLTVGPLPLEPLLLPGPPLAEQPANASPAVANSAAAPRDNIPSLIMLFMANIP
jgi:hypothetical protein